MQPHGHNIQKSGGLIVKCLFELVDRYAVIHIQEIKRDGTILPPLLLQQRVDWSQRLERRDEGTAHDTSCA
jgi:hypothetical protein